MVLQLSDAPSPDEIHDAFEQHVFDLRDFLFRETIIPQVFRAKVDRLLTASEIGETLGVELPCLDDRLPELLPLEGTADQVVRTHAENVGRLRTAMAASLDPTCLTRLGECLVRMQLQYVHWMAQWSASRDLEGVAARPMRDEWPANELADALEAERLGTTNREVDTRRLAEELLRMRILDSASVPA